MAFRVLASTNSSTRVSFQVWERDGRCKRCKGLSKLGAPSSPSHRRLFGRCGTSGSPDFIDRLKETLSDKGAMGEKRVLGVVTNVALELASPSC